MERGEPDNSIEPDLIACHAGHRDVMAAFHARCFSDSWDAQAMAAVLKSPETFGFLALDAADPAGLVLCRVAADECEVLTLGVLVEARRKGIGGRLLDGAEKEARVRGARTIFLEVGAANTGARSLYEVRGYTEVGRRSKYYRKTGGEAEDALVLRLKL